MYWRGKVYLLTAFIGVLLSTGSLQADTVRYQAHTANIGWMATVSDGQTAGTTGQSRQMEAVIISNGSTPKCSSFEYRAHVADAGWLAWVKSGQVAGTTGQSRRMEAVQINMVNPTAGYTIKYRAHVANIGWMPWVTNGQVAGTTGQSRRMEALEIMVVPVGSDCATPAYAPTFWNDNGTIQRGNNCYNYSNNTRTDSFAQPGRASGHMYQSITCSEVTYGAVSDGLEQTTATSTSPLGKTKIALVIAPGYDYHWYRQDSDGKWSHKPGGTKATNLDNAAKIITNPETANRGPYTSFCGYFFICSNLNQGQAHANIR